MSSMINDILDIKDSYQAPQKIMDMLYGDIEERNKTFMEFLKAYKMTLIMIGFMNIFKTNMLIVKSTNKISHQNQ